MDTSASPQQTKPRVLVVDDDEDIRNVLATALGMMGFYVSQAGDRETALALVRVVNPDLILSDWMMPGLPIEPFIEEVRAQEQKPSIILCSAATMVGEKASELGIHFLQKPFDFEMLEHLASKCITESKPCIRSQRESRSQHLPQPSVLISSPAKVDSRCPS